MLEIYIFFQFQMLMSAPTTLVIQMQHVITLLDPSSVLVRKDLLEMVVTAQVWNANVRMEGNLTHFLPSPSYYSLLLLLPFPLISQYYVLLLNLLPLVLLLFLSSLLLLTISSFLYCYYSYFVHKSECPYSSFWNWDFSLAEEYL